MAESHSKTSEQQTYFDQQPDSQSTPQRPLPRGVNTGSSIGRTSTSGFDTPYDRCPTAKRNDIRRPNMERTQTNQTAGTSDTQRLEKKQQQLVDVENEYFKLNPWYNQQKEKPVFGLDQPLPHTMRRGMWWGKSDLKKKWEDLKAEENDLQAGIDARDGLDIAKEKEYENDSESSQTPLRQGQSSQPRSSDQYQSYSHGRMPNVRQPTSTSFSMAGKQRNDDSASQRAPVNNHGLTEADQGNDSGRNHFGLQDGLHPLQELDTGETTQTQKEEKEIKKREHEEQQKYYDQYRNPIARLRAQYPQAPAEFLATFIYLFLGIAANLSIATSAESTGNFESQAWAWGFAVTVGIYLSGGVSGGHLSPCITIALSIFRGFPWRMAVVYICMQMLAGLAAGGLAYGRWLDITGKALFPKGPSFTATTAFFNDFVFMAIYTCIAFALGDDQNSPPGQGMTALIFGFMGYLMMVSLGYNTGLGISPARDLGPRLVGLWAGYDSFSDAYWAYGPFGAATSGAIFGGFIYDLFVFVGGESPVNYRWPEKGDIKWKLHEKKEHAKDKIQNVA